MRYKTYDPHMVWYESFKGQLPRQKKDAVNSLIERSFQYFGVQFLRYEKIVVSLLKDNEPLVDIVVTPKEWVEEHHPNFLLTAELKKSA